MASADRSCVSAESWVLAHLDHPEQAVITSDLAAAWSAQLQQALERLEANGQIVRDGDVIRTPRGPASPEQTHAVIADAYVGLLRAEHAGQPSHRTAVLGQVATATGLPPTKIEALMRNVSAVVQELGYEYLGAYPPASNVPVGVRPAVRAALGL